MCQNLIESDFGLVSIIAMAVAEQYHLATVVGGVAVLHDIRVRALDVQIVWQVLAVHQAVIPKDKTLFGRLNEYETIRVLHDLFHGGFHEGIVFVMVLRQPQ